MKTENDRPVCTDQTARMAASNRKPARRLERSTFQVNRSMEYFSEKELQRQIGRGVDWWPVALLKELIDNGLDACEMHDVDPVIEVEVGEDYFSVQDNGPGLPSEVIVGSLDYSQRISDKALYVSPTRGQLGNALKTVWAAPYVVHGAGLVEIETGGQRHSVEVSLDEVAQQPNVQHTVEEEGDFVKNGTLVRVTWPDSASSDEPDEEDDSYNFHQYTKPPPSAEEIVEMFAAFNPHATFRISDRLFEPTSPGFRKWRGDEPTSPHWYTPETLRSLIAGYITKEREGGRPRTVREFVSEFKGLSGTAKQKRVTEDLSHVQLADLVENGQFDDGAVGRLLTRMQDNSKPVKPAALGVIGQEHMTAWMTTYAGADPDTIQYAKSTGEQDGMPFVVEAAFGVNEGFESRRRILYGLNWTPALGSPVKELTDLLPEMRVVSHDPVTLLFHLSCPRFDFTDHGKGRVAL